MYNDIFNITVIDEETIVFKKANNKQIRQNCDDRKFTLSGNYILSFFN